MSIENFASFNQHDAARGEIEAWRGDCLDLMAKGETMIGAILELARDRDLDVELHSLAVQRTLEALRLVDLIGGTEEELDAARKAITRWQALESRSEILSHGMLSEALDRHACWYAIFDMVSYRAGKPHKGRWVVGQDDAADFLKQLERAHTKLKLQLGCARLRLDD
jgi:hypothetical protein